MHDFDLGAIDLNLLVVLQVLLEERSVSRTARRIGRSQSATSHALARLRQQLDDPLLVSVQGRMEPSPRARELAPGLARSLAALRDALASASASFSPGETTRKFRLAGPDFLSSSAARLIAAVTRQAPRSRIEFLGTGRSMVEDTIVGALDAFVAPARTIGAGELEVAEVGRLEFWTFGRKGHPAFARWSEAEWGAWPHVLVRTDASRGGPVDKAAARRQIERRIGAVLPRFSMVAPVLADSDLLFTGPRAAVAAAVEVGALDAREPPLAIPPIDLALYTSARLADDPALAWFRPLAETVLRSELASHAA